MQFDPKTELYTLPTLTSPELGTLRGALIARRSFWKGEAETFEQLANDPAFDPEKMQANAKAARTFEDEADALLARLDP